MCYRSEKYHPSRYPVDVRFNRGKITQNGHFFGGTGVFPRNSGVDFSAMAVARATTIGVYAPHSLPKLMQVRGIHWRCFFFGTRSTKWHLLVPIQSDRPTISSLRIRVKIILLGRESFGECTNGHICSKRFSESKASTIHKTGRIMLA